MVRQNYKKSSGVKTPVSVWNLTNSMLAVIIILLLIILFAMFPVGAYKLPQQTIGGGGGGGGYVDLEVIDFDYDNKVIVAGETAYMSIIIKNNGNQVAEDWSYQFCSGVPETSCISSPGQVSISPGQTIDKTFTTVYPISGTFISTITVSHPEDDDTSNNMMSRDIVVYPNPTNVTYQGVLNMLGSCQFMITNNPNLTTGNAICESIGETCIISTMAQTGLDQNCNTIISDNNDLRAYCCSPSA